MSLTLKIQRVFQLIGCYLIVETGSTNYNEPITPDVYQSLIGPGFSTKYFTRPKIESLEEYYQDKNIVDVYNAGFRNLRLRCGAKYYPYPYDTANFTIFLNGLESVVDKCLEVGIIPIVSWANSDAAATSTDEDRINYLRWWKQVAKKLKDKDYRLSFNLVTELLPVECKKLGTCNQSILGNRTLYNTWTRQVVNRIRNTGGNNLNRMLILGSPQKDAIYLSEIDKSIYENDPYMMAEYHSYAAGPTGKVTSGRYWEGCGNSTQRQKLLNEIAIAKNQTTLKTYWAAWMAYDNKKGGINQTEAECFAQHFVSEMKKKGIPWSLNNIEHYYWVENSTWRPDIQTRRGVQLNMSRILDVIKENM